MRRVLQITGGLSKNGTETFVMNVYRNINREKIQFDFLVFTDSNDGYYDEVKKLGGRIFRLPSRKSNIIIYLKSLNEFFKTHQYYVVHFHSCTLTTIAPLYYAKKHGVETRIVHSHSSHNISGLHNLVLHKINKLFISNVASHYFACSEVAAFWFYSNTSCYKKRTIIHNGIDLDVFNFDEKVRFKYRRDMNFGENTVYCNISRFETVKNHTFLIDVFNELLKINKNSLLILVGEGPLKNKLMDKIVRLGILEKVCFLGYRSDISEILNAVDVILFPSLFEGIPLALIEAQACALPIFTSTNVSVDVKLTDLVFFQDLSLPASEWAKDIVLSDLWEVSRKGVKEKIRVAGYSISDTVVRIMSFYEDNK